MYVADPCDVTCLQTSALFRDVAPAKLRLVSMASRRETYAPADTIVGEGDPSDAVYILMDGEIEIRRKSHGHDVAVGGPAPGYAIGDIAVLLGEPYPATFVAASAVTVLRLDADVFMQLLRDVPQISMALMRDLGRRVVTLAQKVADSHHH